MSLHILGRHNGTCANPRLKSNFHLAHAPSVDLRKRHDLVPDATAPSRNTVKNVDQHDSPIVVSEESTQAVCSCTSEAQTSECAREDQKSIELIEQSNSKGWRM